MKLPARVRLSRLPGPPGNALQAQLRRLNPEHADLFKRLSELPSPDLACTVVIAGGKIVGYLLAEREEGEWSETLALEPAWRGRGIEEALREELRDLS